MRPWKIGIIASFMLASAAPASASDTYPSRPITVIVPTSPGGPLDSSSRLIARIIGEKLGQPVIIDNKPGASGIIAMEAGAAAKPDGHTITLGTTGQMVTFPWLYKKLPYNPEKSFIGIRASAMNPLMMVFNPSKPYKTLPEFIAYVRKNPDSINYGTVGTGTTGHLAGEMLKQFADIKMTHVLYRLYAPQLNDLMSGVLDIGFELPGPMKGNIEAGNLRPIAVASDVRLKNFPNVPTFPELGYPDLKIAVWAVFLVPAGTPAPIVQKLDAALAEALKTQTMQDYYDLGDSLVLDIGHDKFPAFLASEIAKLKPLVERSGITAE
jgi:tripartite-type tricarboxylate transporter receptor subunit TctC